MKIYVYLDESGSIHKNSKTRYFAVGGYFTFEEGRINSKGLQSIKPKKDKHGLITTFSPSNMMGQITVTKDEIQNLTWLITHLCSIGTCITFNAIDKMGRASKTIIKNK